MYKLEFLPNAKSDIYNIVYYISKKLNNNSAAKKITQDLINGAKSILDFSYCSPIYKYKGELKREYRHIKIRNYLLFYTINKKEKVVTIVRLLYEKNEGF